MAITACLRFCLVKQEKWVPVRAPAETVSNAVEQFPERSLKFCTSLWRIYCFVGFCQIVKSISYEDARCGESPNPTLTARFSDDLSKTLVKRAIPSSNTARIPAKVSNHAAGVRPSSSFLVLFLNHTTHSPRRRLRATFNR